MTALSTTIPAAHVVPDRMQHADAVPAFLSPIRLLAATVHLPFLGKEREPPFLFR